MSLGVLVSYHYFKRENLAELFAPFDERPLVFADSGAFSSHSQGVKIDIKGYGKWLETNATSIDMIATLDVIGDAKATARNTKQLERMGHKVVPVFHVGEGWSLLYDLCEQYDLIALGGMVPHKHAPAALRRWLTKCVIMGSKTKTRFHGFGITAPQVVGQAPLFSVDSTTWKNSAKYGALHLWDDTRGWVIMPSRTLKKRLTERELIRSYGLELADVVRGDYGFATEGHADEYREAQLVSAVAHARFERWFHDRFAPVDVPGLPSGPHTFLSCVPGDVSAYIVPLIKERLT